MFKKPIALLTWDNISSGTTYLYGTKVSFIDGVVAFKNPLIASGKPIKTFFSRTNYQGHRRSPELPALVPGSRYHLLLDATIIPEGRIFIQIDTYNRQGESLSHIILRNMEESFTYPDEAFTYTITLMSAGCEKLIFRSIHLFELVVDKGTKSKNSSAMYSTEDIPDELSLITPLIVRE